MGLACSDESGVAPSPDGSGADDVRLRHADAAKLAGDAVLKHCVPDAALLDANLVVRCFLGNGHRYFKTQPDASAQSAPEMLHAPLRLELLRLSRRFEQSQQPERGLTIENVADQRLVTMTLYPAEDGCRLLVFASKPINASPNDSVARKRAPIGIENQGALSDPPLTATVNVDESTSRERQELRNLQAMLDLAPDPVAIKRVDGTYSYANSQYLDCFGLGRDIRGVAEADALPRELAEAMSTLNEEVFATRQAVRREVHWQQGERSRSSLCLVFALSDADDQVYASVSVFTDITSLRDAREELRQQTYKLQQIIDGIGDSLVVVDRDGKIEQFNKAWQRFVCGCEDSAIPGTSIGDSYLETCLSQSESVYAGLSEMLRQPSPFEVEFPCERQSGTRRYLLRGTPLPTGGAVLLHIDITARYKEELDRRLTEAVFQNANDIILICKPCGEVVMANPQAMAVFERTDLAGEQLLSLFSKEFLIEQGREAREMLRRGKSWRGEAQAVLSDGRVIPLWGSASVIRSDSGTDSYWVVIGSNIAPLKEAQARLSHLAFYDELTGLPNRRFFQENLAAAIHRANRNGQGLSLIFIDLDRFKLINDTYGHDAGDAFLKEVAQRFRSHVREVDLIARMGGDEFTIILEGAQREHDIACVCQKLIDALKPAIKVGDFELFAKCSMGVSRFPHDASEEVGLLRCADLAMYQAKQSGRNQFSFYALEMDAANSQRAAIERRMNVSLLSGGFYPVFQPIVCAKTGKLMAVEALMRWSCPDGSAIGPDVFIPIAEESGLIHPLGEMMLREAAKISRRWDAQGIESLKVHVNVSSVQLKKNFIEVLARVIEEEEVTPWRLEIEITESAMMENFEACVAELHRIRALGVSTALDDFGTGYSSLAHLRHLPISALKIDRSFVKDVHLSERDRAIFRAIFTLAHELGINVVAEGVEHQQQLDALSELGCSLMQGYFYSRPVPIGAVIEGSTAGPWADQLSTALQRGEAIAENQRTFRSSRF